MDGNSDSDSYAPMDPFEGISKRAIGNRLALTREALELRQGEFCKRAGIAQNTYSQFESGKKRPSVDNAIALCEVYGLTLDWIYRGDPSGMHYDIAAKVRELRLRRTDKSVPH